MRIEQVLAGFVRDHLAIVIPLSVLLLRLVMTRLAADAAEFIRSIFSIPEDLVYVAISFVIAALAGQMAAFSTRYAEQYVLTGVLFFVGLFIVSLVVHVLHQKVVQPCYERFFAANEGLKKKLKGKKKGQIPPGTNELVLVYLLNMTVFSVVWLIELSISIAAVGYVLDSVLP